MKKKSNNVSVSTGFGKFISKFYSLVINSFLSMVLAKQTKLVAPQLVFVGAGLLPREFLTPTGLSSQIRNPIIVC